MHFVKVKGILSSKNGMNLYRGCTHGCIYCDSRSDCYNMNHVFEDVEVKENAVELLEYTLRHKRRKCMIGTGSMTDPYIPEEKKIQNVRKSLEVIYKGSLSIVGVSILPYAEIEQYYFMNNCYVCIYKSMQSQKCGNVD